MNAKHYFSCPMRMVDGSLIPNAADQPRIDSYVRDEVTRCEHCSYCGSVDGDVFMRAIELWAQIVPTDKDDKVYVTAEIDDDNADLACLQKATFLFHHLNEKQKERFLELYHAGRLNFGYPGVFFTLPYFFPRRRHDESPLIDTPEF